MFGECRPKHMDSGRILHDQGRRFDRPTASPSRARALYRLVGKTGASGRPNESGRGGTLGKGIYTLAPPRQIDTLTGGDESAMNLGDSRGPNGPGRWGTRGGVGAPMDIMTAQDGVSRERA